jgi:metal-responsive CopG/Arc/MetJ family transcriptional regulator
MGKTAKLTISLPQELVALADRIAKENKISRSRVVSVCLQEMAEKQKALNMAEGYKKLARSQKQFVGMASQTVSEVLPEWKL